MSTLNSSVTNDFEAVLDNYKPGRIRSDLLRNMLLGSQFQASLQGDYSQLVATAIEYNLVDDLELMSICGVDSVSLGEAGCSTVVDRALKAPRRPSPETIDQLMKMGFISPSFWQHFNSEGLL